ncbi:MAG: Nif3-like dinuclear metal center hexameric protein [Candidatus Nitrospinota bacterium M3_3B_026]
MAELERIVSYLDDYLGVERIKDYLPKGLQVEGRGAVERIVTGVSACAALFEEAAARGADAVIVHHGLFWDSEPRDVRGSRKTRLKLLLEKDMSLLAYHLPLDRHPEVGNNIQLVRALGLVDPEPFGDYKGESISCMARTEGRVSIGGLVETVKEKINPDLRHYAFGPGDVELVAVCSGGAPELVREAAWRGADVYLTGEEAEWVYHFSREEGIHYIAAGHHATERLGIIALGRLVEEEFGVDVQFVDIHNPI